MREERTLGIAVLTLALVLALHACPQRIEVAAPGLHSTTATVSLLACGRRVAGPWPARVGYHGLSAHHREGDGTTPLGTYAIGPVVYGLDPDPGVQLRYQRLTCGDWWDEDPRSATYNSFRHIACGATPPFGGGSEALWRATVAYREFAVIAYNSRPVVAGRGSAMFLHDDTGHATNGCVSLPRPDLLRTLRWLRPGSTITIT
jgi:L,D-peptidoglycan transpeptidase YkuD (ErfK/YbiS/YcfS/YnhG family)